MSKQSINIGTVANDGTGSTIRAGGDLINDNFNEIYTELGDGSTLDLAGKNVTFTNKTINSASNTITITESNISDLGSYLLNVSEDTTPELGGDLSTNGNLINFGTSTAADEDRLVFGDSTEFQIFASSSNSTLYSTQSIALRGDPSILLTNSSSQNVISVQGDVANLHYAGSTKLATTSTGVDITGTIVSDGLTVDGTIDNASGNIIVDPATQILEIRGDGSSIVGQIQLNCHVNTHGQIIASQPHSEAATNTLTLPGGTTIGNADATLLSDTGTQTISNKTIGVTQIVGNTRTATGDGSTVAFTVTDGTTTDNTLVFVGGSITTDYTIASTTLTFGSAPAGSAAIVIKEL